MIELIVAGLVAIEVYRLAVWAYSTWEIGRSVRKARSGTPE